MAIYLNLRLLADATKKLRTISTHQEMSQTQMSHMRFSWRFDFLSSSTWSSMKLKTRIRGVRVTDIQVIS